MLATSHDDDVNAAGARHRPPGVFLRGMAMGAADVVPGVSGGTIAFISNIYDELLAAINAVNLRAWQVWRQDGLAALWQHVNATFLLALLAGILTSVFSLARFISYALETYPEQVWGFFFGLILASVVHVARTIPSWRGTTLLALAVGTVVAYAITVMVPVPVTPSAPVFFFSGMLAICAMILPGISGSFILLLLGMYQPVLAAVKGFQIPLLVVFAAGCGLGLLAFSRVLWWLLHHYRGTTLALLTGFMVGSLNKIWPWKHTLEYRLDRHGEQVPLIQENVLPWAYQALSGREPVLLATLFWLVLGVLMVLGLEFLGRRRVPSPNAANPRA